MKTHSVDKSVMCCVIKKIISIVYCVDSNKPGMNHESSIYFLQKYSIKTKRYVINYYYLVFINAKCITDLLTTLYTYIFMMISYLGHLLLKYRYIQFGIAIYLRLLSRVIFFIYISPGPVIWTLDLYSWS